MADETGPTSRETNGISRIEAIAQYEAWEYEKNLRIQTTRQAERRRREQVYQQPGGGTDPNPTRARPFILAPPPPVSKD